MYNEGGKTFLWWSRLKDFWRRHTPSMKKRKVIGMQMKERGEPEEGYRNENDDEKARRRNRRVAAANMERGWEKVLLVKSTKGLLMKTSPFSEKS
mmetsp:Transcript_12846/g.18722  ORF Transcript_12846/g.18722 Transcript_12846/m.18722 type:complete len:95 (+) Transcript_12846:413-697(+)